MFRSFHAVMLFHDQSMPFAVRKEVRVKLFFHGGKPDFVHSVNCRRPLELVYPLLEVEAGEGISVFLPATIPPGVSKVSTLGWGDQLGFVGVEGPV